MSHPSSEASSISPPSTASSVPPAATATAPKRSSRRANTAERRATHNAVERARRETLNGRFLDLAAMLPNLAAVRRPSKSAIVNSSIALINAQRRHRIVAARELRLIKAENDAIRQELNEWRQRANLPRVEEPPRSTDLIALLNLEDDIEGTDESRSFEIHDGTYDEDDFAEEGEDEFSDPHPSYPYAQSTMTVPPAHQLAAHQQQQQQAAALYAHQKAMAARQVPQRMSPTQLIPQTHIVTPAQPLPYGNEPTMFVPDYPLEEKFNQTMFTNTQPQWSQKAMAAAANALANAPSAQTFKPSAFVANQAFLYGQQQQQQQQNMGMFHQQQQQQQQQSFLPGPSPAGSEDETSSVGSSGHEGSHFSAGSSPDHIGLGSSPVDHQFSFLYGQQPQQRRPSVHIPSQAYSGQKSSPVQNTGSQFATMGLMM